MLKHEPEDRFSYIHPTSYTECIMKPSATFSFIGSLFGVCEHILLIKTTFAILHIHFFGEAQSPTCSKNPTISIALTTLSYSCCHVEKFLEIEETPFVMYLKRERETEPKEYKGTDLYTK